MKIPLDDDTDAGCKIMLGEGGAITASQLISWAIYRQFHGNPYASEYSFAHNKLHHLYEVTESMCRIYDRGMSSKVISE